MGSATREALASAREALAKVAAKDALATGTQLFEASRVIGGSAQLRSALADPSAAASDKAAVIGAIFSSLGAPTRTLLGEIVATRWSTPDDLLAGIEEVGIRAVASSFDRSSAAKGDSLEGELFAFGAAVSSDPELELAVGSKLGSPAAKSALVTKLLSTKASPQTLAIVDHLVQQPRGRRIGELIRTAAAIVADQAGLAVATVVTAAPISAAQLERLRAGLAQSYGRDLKLNVVIDPSILGGIRVQIGDDVIDGSVSTRINDLRLQLAG
jgi:F-type H+-transporting ATPase subunit delta